MKLRHPPEYPRENHGLPYCTGFNEKINEYLLKKSLIAAIPPGKKVLCSGKSVLIRLPERASPGGFPQARAGFPVEVSFANRDRQAAQIVAVSISQIFFRI